MKLPTNRHCSSKRWRYSVSSLIKNPGTWAAGYSNPNLVRRRGSRIYPMQARLYQRHHTTGTANSLRNEVTKRSDSASGLQPNRQAKLPVCAMQWPAIEGSYIYTVIPSVGEWGWGIEGKQVGSMDEESQVRGCYNITFICTPTNLETVCIGKDTSKQNI